MQKFKLIVSLLLLTISSFAQLKHENWRALGPFSIHKSTGETSAPGLGVYRTIDIHPTKPDHILIGGMSSGIWLSTDKGITWKCVTAELPVENVKKIQIAPSNPKIVYAASTVGILKSENGGLNWKFTSLNILQKLPCPDRLKLNDDRTLLTVSPRNENELIAAVNDSLFKSVDGGLNWNLIKPDWLCQFLEYHPSSGEIIYSGGANKKTPNAFSIIRSTNGGNNFTSVTKGLPDTSKLVRLHDITASVSLADPDKLYVTIFGDAMVPTTVKKENKKQLAGTFLVSKDKGKSFQLVPQANNYRMIDSHFSLFHPYSADENKNEYNFDYADKSFWQGNFQQVGWATAFAISNKDPKTMVLAGSGAALSTDGGTTWNYLRKQGNYHIHGDIQHAKIIGNDVWLVNDGGVNHIDLQTRVQTRLEGYSGQDLWGFSTSFKSEVMAIGVDHSGTMIYDETIYGKDWYHFGGGDAMTASVNPFDDRYIYATPYNHQIIKRPTFLRDEATSVPSPISFGYIPYRNVEFHPTNIYSFYAVDEDKPHWRYDTCRIVFTPDNGKTIDTLLEFPKKAYGKRVRLSVSHPEYVYAICNKPSLVYKSMDAGKTWQLITPDHEKAIKYGFSDIVIDDRDPNHLFLTVSGFQNEIKVLESKNGGQSWSDYRSQSLPKNEILTAAFQRGTKGGIYLGCYPGVFYTSENLNSWEPVGKDLPYSSVNFLMINYDKQLLRIGTHRGLFETSLVEENSPKARFALNKTKLPSGKSDEWKVFFYDHSAIAGNGSSWKWEFPGSVQGSSSEQNPIIDYETAKPGKYSVRLTITNSKGVSDSFEWKDAIEVKYNYPWNLRERKLE